LAIFNIGIIYFFVTSAFLTYEHFQQLNL